jgi:prepilin-type N-terminal cleavage/methylation domain-containing protein
MPLQPRPSASKSRAAFTLVELLVVISVIAILIAILVPAIGGARNSARKSQTLTLITSVANAISQYKSANNRLPGYFSQAELCNQSNNTSFTQMENALLDLSGGVDPDATDVPHVFTITIGTRPPVKINTLQVGASEGRYLNITAKGVGTNQPQSSGMAPARVPNDQIPDDTTYVGGKFQMPDIIDSWGRPIMLWSRNEAAGSRPDPVKVSAPANPTASDPAALFYWWSNRGYLAAPVQVNSSALGANTGGTAPADGANYKRTMQALLGDPAFPDPAPTDSQGNPITADKPQPLSPRGDFILQSAGVDGVFLNNEGNTQLHYRYLPAGIANPAVWAGESDWRTLDRNDDLIQAGN